MYPVPASDEDSLYVLSSGDDLDVILWRYDQLLAAGVDVIAASELSHQPDAHHRLEALVRRGCAAQTAAEIVR